MELLVGMMIMVVFMGMFTTAIYLMSSTANKVEAVTISTSQTSQAFLRLDKLVRYASAISTPGTATGSGATGDWYVELDGTNSAGVETCTQLRVDIATSQLQQRSWAASTTNPNPSWTPLASAITNGTAAAGSSDVPFSLPAVNSSASTAFQQLQIVLVATTGTTSTATNRTQLSFTALNSSATAANNSSVCQQAGRP
jgi:hypothetical protein